MVGTAYDSGALFAVLLAKELKAKYKNTVLGYVWSLLMPLFQSLVFFVVFSLFLRFPIEDYFLFLSIGFVVWQFFSNSLTQGANVLLANANLIRKTCAPRLIFVAASVGAEAVHLLISLPVLLILMLWCGRVPGWLALGLLPAGIVSVLLMAFGLALIVAVINTYFRDLERIMQILLQVWFYVTPIFYSTEQIPAEYRLLLLLNPVFFPVELLRCCFYAPQPAWLYCLAALALGGMIAAVGMVIFRRFQDDLAEVL